MDKSWENCNRFFRNNYILVDKYLEYREEKISKDELKQFIHDFCNCKKEEIYAILEKRLELCLPLS